jgi:hypothetical protein
VCPAVNGGLTEDPACAFCNCGTTRTSIAGFASCCSGPISEVQYGLVLANKATCTSIWHSENIGRAQHAISVPGLRFGACHVSLCALAPRKRVGFETTHIVWMVRQRFLRRPPLQILTSSSPYPKSVCVCVCVCVFFLLC